MKLTFTQKDYSAPVLTVLKPFGYSVENINGPKVHSLFNVMTMSKDVHDWFDQLDMWFEATVSGVLVSRMSYSIGPKHRESQTATT